MGTWGITAFEDDTAMEYYDSFCENGITASEINKLSETILNKKYDLDLDGFLMDGFDEPTELLVGAEIICASKGKQIQQFPNKEYHSETEIPKINLKIIQKGLSKSVINNVISAIKKIQTDGDIHFYTLWAESESFEEWKTYIDGLIERLSSIDLSKSEKKKSIFLNKLKGFFKK
uniref:DUF4259 domain-containing protein n=1 Tax=Flavobacterium sp. TaxID=239 RepID=UPI00404B2D31